MCFNRVQNCNAIYPHVWCQSNQKVKSPAHLKPAVFQKPVDGGALADVGISDEPYRHALCRVVTGQRFERSQHTWRLDDVATVELQIILVVVVFHKPDFRENRVEG